MYQYPDYLMHYGVRGMKWGRRRKAIATSRLNRKSKKADKYNQASDRWKTKASLLDKQASEAGPIAYGKAYNTIKRANDNAKQLKKYADHYEKSARSYINKVSKNYIVVYDVSTKTYSLKER